MPAWCQAIVAGPRSDFLSLASWFASRGPLRRTTYHCRCRCRLLDWRRSLHRRTRRNGPSPIRRQRTALPDGSSPLPWRQPTPAMCSAVTKSPHRRQNPARYRVSMRAHVRAAVHACAWKVRALPRGCAPLAHPCIEMHEGQRATDRHECMGNATGACRPVRTRDMEPEQNSEPQQQTTISSDVSICR